MSKRAQSKASPKSAKSSAKSSKTKRKNITNDDYVPEEIDDPLDHVIDELEQSIVKASPLPANKRNALDLNEFMDLEAEGPKTKKAKNNNNGKQCVGAKMAKVWTPAQAALLKLLIIGSPPLGRNVACMCHFSPIILYLLIFIRQIRNLEFVYAHSLALTATLNKELQSMDSAEMFTTKEVKSKLETVKFQFIQATPSSLPVPRLSQPLFDNRI